MNGIAPGTVLPPESMTDEEIRQLAERAPLKRNVELGEVADAAVFLLSPASRAITGEVVMVDAGYHAIGI